MDPVLPAHGVQLLKVSSVVGSVPPMPTTSYEAEAAVLGGSASPSDCSACSGGKKVGGLGLGVDNTVTFDNVYARKSGVYLMQVDSMTLGLRSYLYRVNDGPLQTLNSGGGSFQLSSSRTLPVCLSKGYNRIQFGNPTSYPPDLDRIVIEGDGQAIGAAATTYEAEAATLGGTASAGFSNYASGLSKVGNVGGGAANTVTFRHVSVASAGTYQLQLDYATSGMRQLQMTINDRPARTLSLDGSSFDDPASVVLDLPLKAGDNVIALGNPNGAAPDLDRIIVAPRVLPQLLSNASTQPCAD